MTLSILEFARTFELRETMIISLFDRLNSKHSLVKALGLLLCSLFSSAGHGLEIGSPAGLQQIGKRLDLQSNVTGIPAGTESQLRATCLKARARPSGREGVDAFEGLGNDDVQVDFVSTIPQGGVIQFRSSSVVNDALLELELISDCPLLAFRSSWMLIMDPEQAGLANIPASLPESGGRPGFDIRNSVLLKASRVAPKRTALTPGTAKTHAIQAEIPTRVVAQTASEEAQSGAPMIDDAKELSESISEQQPIHLTAIDPAFSDQGLIESKPSLPAPDNSPFGENEHVWMGIDLASPSIWVFLASILMLIMVSIAFGKSHLKQRRASKTSAGKLAPTYTPAQAMFKEYRDPAGLDDSAFPDVVEPTVPYTQDRVLESLMGSEEMDAEPAYEGLKPLGNLEAAETQSRSSLSICIELINKADSRVWNLPAAYGELVASRNKSLDLHRTADALLLRCQVGLVELAFQEARKGRRLPDEVAEEMLNVVIGNHAFDLDATPASCVPDVVKSHVRAKVCEISGAEKRTVLQENLVNLNTQVSNPGLCFSSNAWREFLSEEGILE